MKRFSMPSTADVMSVEPDSTSACITSTTRNCGERNLTKMSLSYAMTITKKLKELSMMNLRLSSLLNQEDIPSEFAQVLNDDFWELVA